MQKKHFFLGQEVAEARDFTPVRQGFGKKECIERDRLAHSEYIKSQYNAAVDSAMRKLEERKGQGLPVADGVYVNLDMDKKLVPTKLSKGATIMKVSDKADVEKANLVVYVKEEKKDWLDKKATDYATKNKKDGTPREADLLTAINDVQATEVRSLYISEEAFDAIPEHVVSRYELWINRAGSYDEPTVRATLESLFIDIETNPLVFDSVEVWLVKATKSQLSEIPSALGYVEGIRPYRQPSVMLSDNCTSREWSNLIEDYVRFDLDEHSPQIAILDTGVNNAHALLRQTLPGNRMDSAINVGSVIDNDGHGTGMAGLALLGDLTDIAYDRGENIHVNHALASIKIFERGYDSSFYGAVIEEGINKAFDFGAKINCMAITDEDSYSGEATSSSAALDESLYNMGACNRMAIVSAGNVDTTEIDAADYLASCKSHSVKSPAQAWNALTVGAYTEKVIPSRKDFAPLAAPQGVSPFTSSSYAWYRGRTKPEIVMEGGNVAYHPLFKVTTDADLSLVTTNNRLQEPLQEFNATSAATALAARLAAKICVANPQLSMLSVRGLMVHSAKWTEEMLHIENIDERMSLCGYGVPMENSATASNDQCATYIFENELVPYTKVDGNNKYNQLHYYALPWPTEELADMGEEKVLIKITLSYYIKPSPGYAGRTNKYRYPSGTLHFDIKKPTETLGDFLRRRNLNEGERDANINNTNNKWTVGQQRRERSTVQSDWIECSAVELSEMGHIVVFPGQGWWKDRKLESVDNRIKYALIVSIETEKTDIYNAVQTSIANKIAIEV